MTAASDQAPATVSSLPPRPASVADLTAFENELREMLRSARDDLAGLLEYVLATRPIVEASGSVGRQLRIAAQQKLDAVRWRLAADLAAPPSATTASAAQAQRFASINHELTEQCAVIERDASKAWSHILSVLAAAPLAP
jgi:hypothetical protein